jgi:predicted nucleotidyltransferase
MMATIQAHADEIAGLCRKFGVARLDAFGSSVRGEFNPGRSDLDFFVEFAERGFIGAADRYFGLLEGLECLFQTRIDLVDLAAATNPYFLQEASKSRITLYAA